mgnify:CR=1 FL=1
MKSFFTETILKRGKTYFEQNRVFSVNQYDNQTYTGIILGNIAQFVKGGGLFAVCVVLFLLPIIYNVIMPKKKEA